MKRENILPSGEADWLNLRKSDITSTEVAGLFNLSPYTTPLQLWHEKNNPSLDLPDFDENERIKWGTRLQDSIATGVAEDQNWSVRRRNVYSRLPEVKLGASFDFEIINHPDGPGILEIKNVDGLVFRNQWLHGDDGYEAPPHIELQLQAQLLASGRAWGAIVALIAGNEAKVIVRKANAELHDEILGAVREFWALTNAPQPDFARDTKVIKALNSQSTEGKVVADDGSLDELVAQYKHLSDEIKGLEELKEATKNELLTLISDAEKVVGRGWSISAATVAEKVIPEYVRASYRGFRVNVKKSK